MLDRDAEPPSLLVLSIDERLEAAALRELATVVREQLRELDVLARASKHQFAIILPETDRDAAMQLTVSLRQSLVRTDALVSIRLAIPGPNDDPDHLLA